MAAPLFRGGRDSDVFSLFSPVLGSPSAPGTARTVGLRGFNPEGLRCLGAWGRVSKTTARTKADAPRLHWHAAQAPSWLERNSGTRQPILPQSTAGSLVYPAHSRHNRRTRHKEEAAAAALELVLSPRSGQYLRGQRLLTAHSRAAAAPFLHVTQLFGLSVSPQDSPSLCGAAHQTNTQTEAWVKERIRYLEEEDGKRS